MDQLTLKWGKIRWSARRSLFVESEAIPNFFRKKNEIKDSEFFPEKSLTLYEGGEKISLRVPLHVKNKK